MDEYDLEKEQVKHKRYISKWSQLVKKLQRPPIEGAIRPRVDYPSSSV